MTLVKACGITRIEDAETACRLGYDAIGVIFAESPRRLDPEEARSICRSVPPQVLRVGVFVNQEPGEVRGLMEYCGLDLAQFHGEEDPGTVRSFGSRAIKALRPRGRDDLEMMEEYDGVFAVLLDGWNPTSRGGSGTRCDWGLAARAAGSKRIILAGGLDPCNVGEAIEKVAPFGVDVSSGVESKPGIKDALLLRDFLREARDAAARREEARNGTE